MFSPVEGLTVTGLSSGALLLGAVDGQVTAGLFDPMLGVVPPPTLLPSIDRSGGGEEGLAAGGREVCDDEKVLMASTFNTRVLPPKFCTTRHGI